MEKKPWETPQLIVLVRSKPEEAVLGACKGTNTDGPSNIWGSAWCANYPVCTGCSNVADS